MDFLEFKNGPVRSLFAGLYRLLLAVAAFADFGHVADELAGGRAWQDITRGCDLRYRAAIAACVAATP